VLALYRYLGIVGKDFRCKVCCEPGLSNADKQDNIRLDCQRVHTKASAYCQSRFTVLRYLIYEAKYIPAVYGLHSANIVQRWHRIPCGHDFASITGLFRHEWK
jgi:hypothetical protein